MDDLLLTPNQYSRLFDAALFTLTVLGYSFVLGIVLSLVFGVARLSEHRVVRGVALVYTEFARGISSIVLLFIMAYAVPILAGIPQANLTMLASIALGLNMGGYGAEIIRGAIESVPRGQTEASIALNLRNSQRLRYVVLPQAMRVILPPMGNLTIEILKGTALVSLIGLDDLTGVTQRLITSSRALGGTAPQSVWYLNLLVIYFVLSQLVNVVFKTGERRVDARFRRRTHVVPDPIGDDLEGAK